MESAGKAAAEADREGLSLDEISKLRGAAQHNSMEAISAAEERYHKAKAGGEEGKQPPSLEEIAKMRGAAQQNSMEAITAAQERYNKAKDKPKH